jgi:hypothetical protein
MAATRVKATSSILLYPTDGYPILADTGYMSFDSVAAKWGTMQQSVGGQFVSNAETSQTDLILIPGIEGAILRPYVLNTDTNMPVYKNVGDAYGEYYSDNDAWGNYYDLSGGTNSLVCYDSDATNSNFVPKAEGAPNFAVRIRKYEAKSGSAQNYRTGQCPFCYIWFGGNFCIYLPYSGPPVLKKQTGGRWEDVKTLRYFADLQSVTDAIDVVVMNVAGKIIITTDWFGSADIYEEPSNINYGTYTGSYYSNFRQRQYTKPQPIVVGNSGASVQMAIRKLNFASSGKYRVFCNPRSFGNSKTIAGIIDDLEDHSYVKFWDGTTGKMGAGSFNENAYSHSIEPCTYLGDDGILVTVVVPGVGAYGPSVVYGSVLKLPPTIDSGMGGTPIQLNSDAYTIQLDRPFEEENTSVSISLKKLHRTTKDGRKKNYYSHIQNLNNYQFCYVELGFMLSDGSYTKSTDFTGLVKEVGINSNGNCEFKLGTAAIQLQETMCNGHWGPYDGLYVVEGMQNVCWECGVPSDRFLIKGYKTVDYTTPLPTVADEATWFTVEGALNDAHMCEILQMLDYGNYKEPKWRPRFGDNGWSVIKSMADYEQGLIYADGVYIRYDPWYHKRVQPLAGQLSHDPAVFGVTFTAYDYNDDIVKNLTAEDVEESFDRAMDTNANLVSELSAKAVFAVGKRVAGGSSQSIISVMINPNLTTNTPPGNVFMPFPKIAVLANPMLDNQGVLNRVTQRMGERLFNIPREWDLVSFGHPEIKPRDLVTYTDNIVDGSLLDPSPGAAVILVLSAKSTWSSSENIAWGKTELQGEHFAYIGGNARIVEV